MELEDRVLFSAAPLLMPVGPHIAANHSAGAAAQPVAPSVVQHTSIATPLVGGLTQAVSHELVIIDSSVPNASLLVQAAEALNDPTRQISVAIVNDNADSLAQITQILSQYKNLDAVDFISHGTSDSVDLGGVWLQAANLNANAATIAHWKSALAPGASLLFYGCDLASTAAGQEVLQTIHNLTGASVAGSTGLTGNASSGGSWNLDYQIGNVQTALPFNANVLAGWQGTLGTFVVTNTNDSGTGSLRDAISQADAASGTSTITFDIGSGVQTITLLSALPTITNSVTIDATSEPGYNGTPLVQLEGNSNPINGLDITANNVTIKGLSIYDFSGGNGIQVTGASGTVIEGNYIGLTAAGVAGANGTGIVLTNSTNSVVGGTTAAQGNVISGNTYGGLRIESGSSANTIEGNFIGTNPAGSAAAANGLDGILITAARNNTIGGTAAGDGNVISGNLGPGIEITGSSSTGNYVEGNLIGVDSTGANALGNASYGVEIDSGATGNVIGASGSANTISGNAEYGVYLGGSGTNSNILEYNDIGTNSAGSAAISNGAWGVYVDVGSNNNLLYYNVISGNTTAESSVSAGVGGVYVAGSNTSINHNIVGLAADGATSMPNGNSTASFSAGIYVDSTVTTGTVAYDQIADNVGPGVAVIGSATEVNIYDDSIFGNTGLAIDLGDDGVTANRTGSASGPNDLQNYPVLTAAYTDNQTGSNSAVYINGTLSSAANTTYRIDFYASPTANSSGHGDAQYYLGSVYASTNSSGNATFAVTTASMQNYSFAIAPGWTITATATDPLGNTSELAANRTALTGGLIVTNTSDVVNGNTSSIAALIANPGFTGISLREAILAANNTTIAGGSRIIDFDIPGSGVQEISPTSALPALTSNFTIDGSTQPGWSAAPVIQIDGASAGLGVDGLTISGNGNLVKDLAITDFTDRGIVVNGSYNAFYSNYVGLSPNGSTVAANYSEGFLVSGRSNIIGQPGEGNVISGNGDNGVEISGSSAAYNLVQANDIGTDATGTFAVANASAGVEIDWNAANNVVGGSVIGAGNVISGNSNYGVLLQSGSNTVSGNIIGLNAAGDGNISNIYGIYINSVANTTIGGDTTAERNVISGNSNDGIFVNGTGASGTVIEGNYIGTDTSGTVAIGNNDGIWVNGVPGVMIGGTTTGSGNLISGNAVSGIFINGAASTNTVVEGNLIGTNYSGSSALGNSNGISIYDATDATIGGSTSGSGNVISGNSVYGIEITGSSTTGTTIEGNDIGTDPSGSIAIGNGDWGVYVGDGVASTTIGGTASGDGNLISGNGTDVTSGGSGGIYVDGTDTNIEGNTIGLNSAQTAALENGSSAAGYSAGIYEDADASGTVIGGTATGAGNTIADNIGPGVAVVGNSDIATIESNAIYGNSGAGIDLGDDGPTANHDSGPITGPNGFIDYPVLTSVTTNGSGQITVTGFLYGAPNTTYRLELFASTSPDSSGFGQGQQYLGYYSMPANGSGYYSGSTTLPFTVAAGEYITATVSDPSGRTSEFSNAILVNNNAPVLSGANALTAIDENPSSNAGTLVSAIIAGQVTDADSGALYGIAVTAVDNSNGAWQYSTNGGSTWMAFNAPSMTAAQLLAADANTYVRFVPNANWIGTDAGLTFFAWDQTVGVAGNTINVAGTGGGTPFSSASATASISVNHVDEAPENMVPGAQSTADDTSLVFSTSNGNAISVSDADSGGGVEQVSLSVNDGVLTLNATTGLTVTSGANGSASLTVQGTLADINQALNGLSYVSTPYYNSSDTLTVVSNDLGNSGVGGPLTATNTVSIQVTHTNVAPVNTLPGTQSVADDTPLVFSASNNNAISVSDADSEGGVEQVQLSVGHGTLTLGGTSGLTSVSGNGTASVTIQGTLTNINNSLSGLTYISAQYFNSNDTLSIVSDDLGNSGAGVSQSTTNSLTIAVTHTDIAPVNSFPGTQNVADDTPLVFSTSNNNAISVSDADSEGGVEQFQLSVDHGTLTLGGTSGLTSVTGNGSASVTLQGTLSNINNALNGLTYVSTQYFNGNETLTLTSDDLGNSGAGGAQSTTNSLTIAVTHTNIAPITTLPSTQSVADDTPLVFSASNNNAITVSDTDSQGGVEQVQLRVSNGTLTLGGTNGLTSVSGNGTASVTVQGTVAHINSALSGLTFVSTQFYDGNDTLTLTSDDLGNSGSGGAQSATNSVTIAVTHTDLAPVNTVPGTQDTTDATSLVFSTSNGNPISVSDADNEGGVEQVRLSVSDGTLTLNGTAGLSVTAGANGSAFVQVEGTLANINQALNGLTYVSTLYYNGSDTLAVISNDLGNSGVGGPLMSTNTVSIQVTHANLAPVNSMPGTQSVADDTPLVFSAGNNNAVSVSDADNQGGVEQVNLSVGNGSLTLGGTSGLTSVSGNGSANVTIRGTLANINNALNGLTYVSTQYFNGNDALALTSDDLGNSGAGGAESSTSSTAIAVTHANLAPVNVLPSAQAVADDTPLVFSAGNNNAISVSDADSGGGVEQANLSVGNGSLTLGGTSGLTSVSGNGSANVTIRGTLANINNALNGLTYVSAQYFNGNDALALTSDDLGNSGSGGAQATTNHITIAVTHTDIAPFNTTPGPQTVISESSLIFSPATGNALQIGDPDAESNPEQVALSVAHGTIRLGGTNNVTVTGGGNNTAAITVTGTLTAINAALDGVLYTPTANYVGSDALTVATNDLGNSGVGGPRTAAASIAITVSPRTVDLGLSLPGTQTPGTDAITFSTANGNAIVVLGSNVYNDTIQVTLSATSGQITLGQTQGITIVSGNAASSSQVIFQGSLSAINASLSGLRFVCTSLPSSMTITAVDTSPGISPSSQAATGTVGFTPQSMPTPAPTPSPTPDQSGGSTSTPDSTPSPSPVSPTSNNTTTDNSNSTGPTPSPKPPAAGPAQGSNGHGSSGLLSNVAVRSSLAKNVSDVLPEGVFNIVGKNILQAGKTSGMLRQSTVQQASSHPSRANQAMAGTDADDIYLPWNGSDAAKDEAHRDNNARRWRVGAATTAAAAGSLSFLLTVLRSSALLTSALSTAPAWLDFDPLPVLDFDSKFAKHAENSSSREDEEREERDLHEIIGGSVEQVVPQALSVK